MNHIRQMCTEYGIADNVIFLGRMPRQLLMSHLKNAFLALVLSKNETFGHNILEPLQLEIPVISTPTGIAPQIITDFRNGFTIARNDKSKWESILAGVIDGSIQLEAKHQELYTWPEVAKIYTKLYNYISMSQDRQ
ncbi:MAG: glycosyltransferase [Bacteroides sp.]|nr:glycosyltransferase [Bacteroides sp.]